MTSEDLDDHTLLQFLTTLEQAAFAGRTSDATEQLSAIFAGPIDSGYELTSDLQDRPKGVEMYSTRLGAVITRLLTDPGFQFTQASYEQLITHNRNFAAMWTTSGYRNSDHLPALLAERQPSGAQTYNIRSLAKLLTFSEPDRLPAEIARQLSAMPVELAVPFSLAVLTNKCNLTPEFEALRNAALQSIRRIETYPVSNVIMVVLIRAWMQCSYALADNKHDIKSHLNTYIRRWIESFGVDIRLPENDRPIVERPRLLIALEKFRSDHAMYRCYAPQIRELKQRFEVILLTSPSELDEHNQDLFDDVVAVEMASTTPDVWISSARSVEPDMAYFPSVGMSVWVVALANVRIAPIQIMSMGHPATTRSDCVDYVMTREGQIGDPALFTETIIAKGGPSRYYPPTGEQAVIPNIRIKPRPVKIAVPARSFKLNHLFISVCERIAEKASRPVEFHFFVGEKGLLYWQLKRVLETRLPARVYVVTDFNSYIANLNECDLHLSTFPFGATNGLVDSARQGLPIVCLRGREPHTNIDPRLSLQLGLPDWLRTNTTDEYVNAVLRLVANDDERLELSHRLAATSEDLLLAAPGDDWEDEQLEVFWLIYLKHEELQRRRLKLLEMSELRALPQEPSQH